MAPGGGWSWGRQHIPLQESALLLLLPCGVLQSWHRAAAEFQPSMGSLPPKISVFGESHTTESSRLHHLPVQCQHWGRIKQDSNRLKSLGYKLTPSWGCFLQNYFPFQALFAYECVDLSTQTGGKISAFISGRGPATSCPQPKITLLEGMCLPSPRQLVFASHPDVPGSFIPSKLLSSLVIPFGV